jgi:hypothetical protein
MPHPAKSDEKAFLPRIVASLAAVPGVRAVVLGGSQATGTADDSSDYDIGLYYKPKTGIDIDALRVAATKLEAAGRDSVVTPIGEWGPWINGGAWLTIAGRRVDLLYRDLERVRTVVEDCVHGTVGVHYQPGHPHAFVTAIYCGEVAECHPLFDAGGDIAALKRRTLPYPPALGEAIVRTFLWEAAFAIAIAEKSAERGDAAYVSGCAFRAIACLCQVLFATNGRYLLNEKGAVSRVDALNRVPTDFGKRIEQALRLLGAGELTSALLDLKEIAVDTAELAN